MLICHHSWLHCRILSWRPSPPLLLAYSMLDVVLETIYILGHAWACLTNTQSVIIQVVCNLPAMLLFVAYCERLMLRGLCAASQWS